jgi:hypothetical protein
LLIKNPKYLKPEFPIELPPKYYLDNFKSLLEFVENMYGNILGEKEIQFITAFGQLSEDAQCLYLRMMNRSKRFFRANKFSYEEINISEEVWQELIQKHFIISLEYVSAEHFEEIGQLFTKPELAKIAKKQVAEIPKGFSQSKKEEILSFVLENVSFEDFKLEITLTEYIIAQGFAEITQFLLFLYFGNLHRNMTEFVIRDLGNSKYEDFEETDFTPYFNTRKDADDKFAVAQTYRQFKLLREVLSPQQLFEAFKEWLPERETLSHLAFGLYDKLISRLGDFLEKAEELDEAFEVYEYTQSSPARERQVRIRQKQKRTEEAISLCQLIEQNPQNAHEKYFAIDFVNRVKHKKVKSTTAYLKTAPVCQIGATYTHQVEHGVLQHYIKQGKNGFRSENGIWRGFFGLFFWDLLFESETKSIHNPFQRVPSDLYQPEFYLKREAKILERLEILNDEEKTRELIWDNFDKKYGIFNTMVGWQANLLEGIHIYIQKLEVEQLQKTLLKMAKNVREHTKGFPDLFIYDDDSYQFVEVKSPKDTLSAQQLDWLHFFSEIGIEATALKVEWIH